MKIKIEVPNLKTLVDALNNSVLVYADVITAIKLGCNPGIRTKLADALETLPEEELQQRLNTLMGLYIQLNEKERENKMKVKNDIYNIMVDYETEGLDLYNYGVIEAIRDMLHIKYPSISYEFDISEWPDETGGVCAIALAYEGDVGLVIFDFKY